MKDGKDQMESCFSRLGFSRSDFQFLIMPVDKIKKTKQNVLTINKCQIRRRWCKGLSVILILIYQNCKQYVLICFRLWANLIFGPFFRWNFCLPNWLLLILLIIQSGIYMILSWFLLDDSLDLLTKNVLTPCQFSPNTLV